MLAVTSKANRCALPFLIIHLVIFREREREGERERNIDVMCKSPLSQPGPLPFKKKKGLPDGNDRLEETISGQSERVRAAPRQGWSKGPGRASFLG